MESTHDVQIGVDRVTKRFVSFDRGEADREWRALQLLDRYAPGLAPVPLDFRHEGDAPVVVMSRLPGLPLGSAPLTSAETHAMADALNTLHSSVPPTEVGRLPPRLWAPEEAIVMLREETTAARAMPTDLVAEAWGLGSEWVHSAQAQELQEDQTVIFARADGNLANFVFDGMRCRIVDFEDSGASDLAFELADMIEHVSAWLSGILDADLLLAYLDLDPDVAARVHQARRAMALFWLWMLLPGNRGFDRNPPGSADRQAQRLLDLLA